MVANGQDTDAAEEPAAQASAEAQPAAAATKSTKPTRPKTQRQLPTDRIALSKQVEILRAYGELSQDGRAVSNGEVAKMVELHTSTTSLANGFFVEAGLLQRDPNGHVPVAEVIAFSRAHAFDPESAPQKLAPLLARAWFGTALVRKVNFRTHTRQEALAALAEAAGASKDHRNQLESLLELLATVGLVQLDGDQVKAARVPLSADPTPPKDPPPPVAPSVANGAFQLSLSLTLEEIARLPPDKITAFMSGVAELMKLHAEAEAARKRGST